MVVSSTIKAYYRLTKPGIIYGNVMTTIASFLFASKLHVNWFLFIATILGTSLIIGSAGVFNNVLDQSIDEKMERTQKRALVTGKISNGAALVYGLILIVAGFGLLISLVNWLTVLVGFIGMVFYIAVYGWFKRHSVYGTLVGSISGSMPIVAGYTAVVNKFDLTALILFLILAFWQMPHFYSIGIYRLKDYKAAGLPIWPVKYGIKNTKIWIVVFTSAYLLAALVLGLLGYAGFIYTLVVGLMGIYWLWLDIKGFTLKDSQAWARQAFGFSLINLLVFSIMLAVGSRLT